LKDTTLDQLSKKLFEYLHVMDDEAGTPSGKRNHAGLTGQSERNWNDGLKQLLIKDEPNTYREYPYPDSDERCDIVVKTSDSKTIWLEIKAAWKRWFGSDSGEIEESYPNGYLSGNKGHTAAKDIMKLDKLDSKAADYIALLIIGLDSSGAPITSNIEKMIEKENLRKKGWNILGPEIWSDRNHPNCRYNLWFLGKKVSA
jgi:hypothetical protein